MTPVLIKQIAASTSTAAFNSTSAYEISQKSCFAESSPDWYKKFIHGCYWQQEQGYSQFCFIFLNLIGVKYPSSLREKEQIKM